MTWHKTLKTDDFWAFVKELRRMEKERIQVKLDLSELHDGNAHGILAAFRKAARQQKFDMDKIDKICEEAKDGDYNHLLQTIMAHSTL